MFWSEARIDESVAELREINAEISDLRKRASVIVNELNKRGVAQRRGARPIAEWLSATLDLSRSNAADLVLPPASDCIAVSSTAWLSARSLLIVPWQRCGSPRPAPPSKP